VSGAKESKYRSPSKVLISNKIKLPITIPHHEQHSIINMIRGQ